MRICILTPSALGSNPRVVKEATALHENGNEITVITTRTLDQVDRRDDAVLATADWQAHRLDFRVRGNVWRMRRAIQIAYARAFSVTNHGAFADRGFSAFTGPLMRAAQHIPADLYIAHYPAALPAATMAARLNHALYSYDAEDFHLGDWPNVHAHELERGLVRAIEERYLPGCSYVTAASPGIADAYVDAYGITRPTVVLNVFPRAQSPSGPTPAGTALPGPSVYWFSQTIGPDRGLECALHAIGRARSKPHLYLRGTPASGFIERLRAIAVEVGAADRLHILAAEPPQEMERLAVSYDVGLVGETGQTHNHRIALSNKQFSYLLAGLPAVMSDTPAHRAFSPEAGKAVRLYSADDADSLATALDSLLRDSVALSLAREAAFRLGQTRFNWDLEKSVLLRVIANCDIREPKQFEEL